MPRRRKQVKFKPGAAALRLIDLSISESAEAIANAEFRIGEAQQIIKINKAAIEDLEISKAKLSVSIADSDTGAQNIENGGK